MNQITKVQQAHPVNAIIEDVIVFEPKLFTFDSLSKVACNRLKVHASEVKQAALSLYDMGLISYPLTSETCAYSYQKNSIHKLLLLCSISDVMPLNVASKEAVGKLEQNADTLFISDEQTEILGAVSGIVAIGLPHDITLSVLEYALYILVLTQVKHWLLSSEKPIEITFPLAGIPPVSK